MSSDRCQIERKKPALGYRVWNWQEHLPHRVCTRIKQIWIHFIYYNSAQHTVGFIVLLFLFQDGKEKERNRHSPSDQIAGTNKYLLQALVPNHWDSNETFWNFSSWNVSPFSILLPMRKKYSYPFIRLIPSFLLSIFILSGLLQELPLLNPPMLFILIPSFSITASLQPTSKLKSPFIKKKKNSKPHLFRSHPI